MHILDEEQQNEVRLRSDHCHLHRPGAWVQKYQTCTSEAEFTGRRALLSTSQQDLSSLQWKQEKMEEWAQRKLGTNCTLNQ